MTIKECAKLQKKIEGLFTEYTNAHHAAAILTNDNMVEVVECMENAIKAIKKIAKIAVSMDICKEDEINNYNLAIIAVVSSTEKTFLKYCLENDLID